LRLAVCADSVFAVNPLAFTRRVLTVEVAASISVPFADGKCVNVATAGCCSVLSASTTTVKSVAEMTNELHRYELEVFTTTVFPESSPNCRALALAAASTYPSLSRLTGLEVRLGVCRIAMGREGATQGHRKGGETAVNLTRIETEENKL